MAYHLPCLCKLFSCLHSLLHAHVKGFDSAVPSFLSLSRGSIWQQFVSACRGSNPKRYPRLPICVAPIPKASVARIETSLYHQHPACSPAEDPKACQLLPFVAGMALLAGWLNIPCTPTFDVCGPR